MGHAEPAGGRCDVLHVAWSGDPSGIISQLAGLLRHARDAGTMTQRACFLDGRGLIGDALVEEGLALRLGLRRGWTPGGLRRLARTLRRARPRIVHFHDAAFGPLVVAFAALPASSFVWTQHDPGVLTRSVRFDLFFRLFRRRFSRFVVPSAAIVRALEAHGVTGSSVTVVPHGLTIPLGRGGRPAEPHNPTVGTVARLHREKRLDLFLDVVAELHARRVEVAAIVVGDGPDREHLVRHARERGIEAIVNFVGEDVDVARWLDHMDVFLSTSAVEIAGLAPLEAMARGVPVVALPARGGMTEVVARGGRLVSKRHVATAADTVAELLADPDALAELRVRGTEVAAEHTLDRTLAALEALYREVDAERHDGR